MANEYMDSFMYGNKGPSKAKKTTAKKTTAKKTTAKKTTARPLDKSAWSIGPAPKASIKVSQAKIDKIKSMGMTKALKQVNNPNRSKAFNEGVLRLYGANRVAAAKKAAPSSTRVSPRNTEMSPKAKASPRATEGRVASQKRPTSSKKSGLDTQTKIVRGIAGTGAAVLGGLAIKKLGPVGAATAAAGAVKGLSKTATKYLPKPGTKLTPLQAKALAKAKAGKPLTPGQYQALRNAAKKSNKGEGVKKAKNAAKVKPGLNKKKTGAMAGASTTTLSGDTPKRR